MLVVVVLPLRYHHYGEQAGQARYCPHGCRHSPLPRRYPATWWHIVSPSTDLRLQMPKLRTPAYFFAVYKDWTRPFHILATLAKPSRLRPSVVGGSWQLAFRACSFQRGPLAASDCLAQSPVPDSPVPVTV